MTLVHPAQHPLDYPLDTTPPIGVSRQVAIQIIEDRSNFKDDTVGELRTYVVVNGQPRTEHSGEATSTRVRLAAWQQFVSRDIPLLMTAGGC